ncbi:MAG TPA: S8 family serine peptidase [Chloroflexota bacterium]|nr:S8 family serine peptidase [Chloroflexota bacterium]
MYRLERSARTLCCGLAVLAALLGVLPRASHAQPGPPTLVPGEIEVQLAQASDLPAVAAAYGLDPTPLDQFGSRSIYLLRILSSASPNDLTASMLRDIRVVYAEPNLLFQSPEARQAYSWAVGGDAGSYVAQWAPAAMQLPAAQAVTRGADVTVAVLDTGDDLTHPALAGHLLPGYDFVDMDSDPSEVGVAGQDLGFGHGTHVAGLVALAAPDAKILPLRVLDQHGVGNIWVLTEALAYAMNPDGNPTTHDGADVINLSLTIPTESRLLRDTLRAVTCTDDQPSAEDIPCLAPDGHGAVVVEAAGNSGSTNPEYPAGDSIQGAITVGASTQSATLATFSNRGSWVNVAAPGDRILSSVPGGLYATWSGTSMAAPLVAGVAALVHAAYPTLDPAKVVQRIESTADNIGGPVSHLVDAAAALRPTGGGR